MLYEEGFALGCNQGLLALGSLRFAYPSINFGGEVRQACNQGLLSLGSACFALPATVVAVEVGCVAGSSSECT